ncbi:hypothetical protein SAMN04488128_1011149 [Chitinophaga eiseniae]|uniref:PIN domain-containing protein n=2 Tax=Chitinophaga eiseniae TaxID=634771 RepID=A0A1T4MKH4_9BACT|nr:hypothetical protein SAMN04488128_1011149 [Chitinophaga eiseniae]
MEILSPYYDHEPDPDYNPYINFHDRIVGSSQKDGIKILMPAIVMSELIGKHVAIGFDEYLNNLKIKVTFEGAKERKKYFKETYRKTDHYLGRLKGICDSIKDYYRHLDFLSDNLQSFKLSDILKNPPLHMEFNDHLLARIAGFYQCPLITHDGDFSVEDVPIFTANRQLLSLAKAVKV